MRIEWLTQATDDFEDAMQWITERNPHAARQAAIAAYQQISQLVMHPHLGRPGRVPGTRELVIAQTHFIAPYQVREREQIVEILAFIHDARQWPEVF